MGHERRSAGTVRQRIDLFSDIDVAFWCHVLAVDPIELRRAVQQVGPQAAAVRRYLAGRMRSSG